MQAMPEVSTDADGTARIVQFAPSDMARMGDDPAFRRFAERARKAVFETRNPPPRVRLSIRDRRAPNRAIIL